MRIFLAGGTGVIGSRLIPVLVAAGHDVTATTRREDRLARLGSLGARGVLVDVYDAEQVAAAVAEAAPDLVMHQLTDLSGSDREANARIRRDGTANLVAAAEAAGVERLSVQSIAWVYPEGDAPATEDEPLVPGASVAVMEELVQRIKHATVLRNGVLYGPGTWYAPGGAVAAAVAAGQHPATSAITPFVHIDDAVTAAAQSVGWPDGIYNIVDDDPAPGTEWLPIYAAGIGAPAPPTTALPPGAPVGRHVSNAKARRAGWTLTHPTWREALVQLQG